MFEVNTWLWNFGRGKPRLGGLTVDETATRDKAVKMDQAKRSAETHRRRRAARPRFYEIHLIESMYVALQCVGRCYKLLNHGQTIEIIGIIQEIMCIIVCFQLNMWLGFIK